MNPLRVVFRTDSSVLIGSGHVMRCLTLAEELRARGAECWFVCREHEGHMLEEIRHRGFVAYGLPISSEAVESQENRSQSAWLGSDWATDAAQTRVHAGEPAVDWLIVDHYALDARWEQSLRPNCRNLMVIDDIANRPHLCDLLIDQNYEDKERYKHFVNTGCRLLLGPRYALLRPEYAEHRTEKKVKVASPKRVFVFFGGSDLRDMTGTTLQALSAPTLNELEVDVVVGANYRHYESLNQHAFLRGKTTIYRPRAHLADLMSKADIAIGAGGVANWERMCLGLPSLVVVMAENQAPISEILHRLKAIRLLGKAEEVSKSSISDALLDEMKTKQFISRIATAMALCDGLGVSRVVRVMHTFP